MTRLALLLMLALSRPDLAQAAHPHVESYYQDIWCTAAGGRSEAILNDKTRVDCLTDRNSVEVDFGHKFYEAVGQSLYYSAKTGKRAGILLIIERPADEKYWARLNWLIKEADLPIDTWRISP